MLGFSEQGVVFGVANNVVTFGDLDFPWFWKGFLDFVLDILRWSFGVKTRQNE